MTPQVYEFEGRPLSVLKVDGRPAWVAREVGGLLGYADNGRPFVRSIADRWGEEFIPDRDFAIIPPVKVDPLNDSESLELDSPRGHLVLFESGLHLALLKTRKPLGRRLRRWLVEEVLPSLARSGSYTPEPSPTAIPDASSPPALPPPPSGAALAAAKEMRNVAALLREAGAEEGEILQVVRAAALLLVPDLCPPEPPRPSIPEELGPCPLLRALYQHHADGKLRRAKAWVPLAEALGVMPDWLRTERAKQIWIGQKLTAHARRCRFVVRRGADPKYSIFQSPEGEGEV